MLFLTIVGICLVGFFHLRMDLAELLLQTQMSEQVGVGERIAKPRQDNGQDRIFRLLKHVGWTEVLVVEVRQV